MASGQWADISEEAAASRGVALVNLPHPTPEETRTLTEGVLTLAATGRLQPVIGQRFPLDQAAQAHMAIESRATVGKTLLEVRK
jgi:NADPH2:quinone reductase